MPNYPSIYLELQELWKRLRRLENIFEEHERRISDLEDITQCMDHIDSPTPSTVFNCDVRISGSGTPTLYVGPDVVDDGTSPENELAVFGKTDGAFVSIYDGAAKYQAGVTSSSPFVGSSTDHDFLIKRNNITKIAVSSSKTSIYGQAQVTNLPTVISPSSASYSLVMHDSTGNLKDVSFSDAVIAGNGLQKVTVSTNLTGSGTPSDPVKLKDSVYLASNLGVSGSFQVGQNPVMPGNISVTLNLNTSAVNDKFVINNLDTITTGSYFLVTSGSSGNIKKMNVSNYINSFYATGSWIPEIKFDTEPAPFQKVYDAQFGRWIRTGDLVHISCKVSLAVGNGFGSGNAYIILPFSPSTSWNIKVPVYSSKIAGEIGGAPINWLPSSGSVYLEQQGGAGYDKSYLYRSSINENFRKLQVSDFWDAQHRIEFEVFYEIDNFYWARD